VVVASAFVGLRPPRWERLDHLQPRSADFDRALRDAQQDLGRRRSDNLLVADPHASASVLWIDEQLEQGPRRTAGIVIAARVDPRGNDRIVAHEQTFPEPVARRVRTRNTLAVETVPTLLVLRDQVEVLTSLLGALPPPSLERKDAAVGESIAPLAPELTDEIIRSIRGVPALIADGHHRIAAAADVAAVARGTAMAWLAAADAPPRMLPVHRILHSWPLDADRRLRDAGIQRTPMSGSPHPLHPVLVLAQGAWALRVRRNSAAAAMLQQSFAPQVRDLPVALAHVVLHDILALGTRRAEITTVTNAAAALDAIGPDGSGGALLACGPTLAEVWVAALAGVLMPPKATWFSPKPSSGAIVRPLSDAPSEQAAP
jgi:hypothetical protein